VGEQTVEFGKKFKPNAMFSIKNEQIATCTSLMTMVKHLKERGSRNVKLATPRA